jgi:hypothetical protein
VIDRYYLVCVLKRFFPVEFACHDERAVGIGSKVPSISSNLLSEDLFSGIQVPRDGCSTDGLGDSEELICGDDKCLREKGSDSAMQAKDDNTPLKQPAPI